LRHFPSTRVTLAMARSGKLDHRVRSILAQHRSRRGVRGAATIGLVGVVTVLVGIIAAAEPTVVFAALPVPPDISLAINHAKSRSSRLSQKSKEAPKAKTAKTAKHSTASAGGPEDFSNFDAEMEKVGKDTNEQIEKAMKNLKVTGLDSKEFAKAMAGIADSSTKAAIESAKELGSKKNMEQFKKLGEAFKNFHPPSTPATH